MRQYFTSLQVFLAAALAMVVFIGILWVEKSNFNKVSDLEDPYESAVLINERVVVNGTEARSWLHKTGEIFILMPGGKLNMTNQARELEEGVLFLNSSLQDQADIDQAKVGFSAPFALGEARLSGGQIKIGPIVVSIPQGVAVLKRDLVRQEAIIYAHDHPVYIYLPSATEPFLVPAGYMVLVKENRATLLAPLYFTKLKKELKLEPLDDKTLGMESVQSALLQGIELSRLWEQQVILYAEESVVALNRFAPDSVMGKLLNGLYFIQRFYALGVDDNFKDEYGYKKLTAQIRNVYFAFADADLERALKAAQEFTEVRGGADWARYFIETPTYKKIWSQFAKQQRVWFYGAFPDDREVEVLKVLWGPKNKIVSFEDFQDNYFLFETYYAQNYIVPAQRELQFILDNFTNLDYDLIQDSRNITQARRQVSLLLQRDAQRSNSIIFELYIELVEAERLLRAEESELGQEVRLEVAQELLYFLDKLLDSRTRQDEVIILLKAYKNLDIGSLAESLGRSVFNEKERETLNRVQSLENLTEEDMAMIRADNVTAEEVKNLREQLRNQAEQIIAAGPTGVQTIEDLTDFFLKREILTQGMRVQINEKDDNKFMTFNQASYNGYPLQGTFETERQKFSLIKLGEITETRATASNFSAFLSQMLSANEKLRNDDKPEVVDDGPNNGTSTAILQRRNILKLLEQQGISAKFDNILLTNDKLTKATVRQASFEKKYLLVLDFDIGPPIRIRNVTVEFGRSSILLAGQVFPLETLQADLLKAIEAKLEEVNLDSGA